MAGAFMVNLEWYRSFVATYQTGTVTKAAQQRFLTQPTISQHIAALEQALKTPLFERTARQMRPTNAARALYPKVIASIERLEAIEHSVLSLDKAPWFRLGVPSTYFYHQLLKHDLFTKMNEIRFEMVYGETDALIKALVDNKLDAVVATQKTPQGRLLFTPLQQEVFQLAMPGSLKMKADQPSAMEAWLSQQSWISYSLEMPIIRRYWQRVFNKRPDFEPQLIIPDLQGIYRAVELGLGISVLPDYLFRQKGGNKLIRTLWASAPQVDNTLYLVCHRDRAREPVVQQVMQSFKRQINTEGE